MTFILQLAKYGSIKPQEPTHPRNKWEQIILQHLLLVLGTRSVVQEEKLQFLSVWVE